MDSKKLNEMVVQQTESFAEMNLETPSTNPPFADDDDVVMTDVADDHTALNKHIGPRYTKRTPIPARTSAIARMKREQQEAEKMAKKASGSEGEGQRTHPTIQEVTESGNMTWTYAPPDNAINNEDLGPSTSTKLPFLLKHCLPKVGMLYSEVDSSQRFWKNDEIVRALWSQSRSKDKKIVQALIAPSLRPRDLKDSTRMAGPCAGGGRVLPGR